MDFGWKKKVERLRMTILSGAHQLAEELPPGLSEILAIFARVAASGDGTDLERRVARVADAFPRDPRLLWEPVEIYGWSIQATMYLRNAENAEIWWLVHAMRGNEREPSDRDVSFLNRALGHLGADPGRDAIIGPASSPPGRPALFFGWWTWQNRWPLYEIQVNEHQRRDADRIRIVPLGTCEADGYRTIDLREDRGERSE